MYVMKSLRRAGTKPEMAAFRKALQSRIGSLHIEVETSPCILSR